MAKKPAPKQTLRQPKLTEKQASDLARAKAAAGGSFVPTSRPDLGYDGEFVTEYRRDPTLKGTVVPSHVGPYGKSAGFDPHAPLPYNVIVTAKDGSGNETVTSVDPTKPTTFQGRAKQRAAKQQPVAAPPKAEDVPVGVEEEEDGAVGILSPSADDQEDAAIARHEKAKADAEKKKPKVKVTFVDYGQLTVPYRHAFIDANSLVLVYDDTEEFKFEPPVREEPFQVRMPDDKVYVVHSTGIRFVMPGTSLVFLVLLVDHERKERDG